MRHSFQFPKHVQDAVRSHIESALAFDPRAFRQEPAYTAALLGRLTGIAYQGDDAFVSFFAANVDSVGPGSAEKWAGADFAVTATVSDGFRKIDKAILTQVKFGSPDQLSGRDRDRLMRQIRAMRRLTRSPKVMFVTDCDGKRCPRMLSGIRIVKGQNSTGLLLPNYIVARILTTFDGDTRPLFVNAVQDGSLANLRIIAEIKRERESRIGKKRIEKIMEELAQRAKVYA